MRGLLLLGAAVSATLSLIMVVFLREHRRHAGFSQWTAGTALISLMFLSSGLRGLIPAAISVVGVNAPLLAAAPIFLDGTRRFLGQPRLARWWYAAAAVAFGGCLYFLFVRDDVPARTVILMTASAVAFAATVALLLRHRAAARSRLFSALAVEFALLAAVMAARGLSVFGRRDFTLLLESPSQFAFFGAAVVLHLGITVTLILLTTERVAAQLSGASAELESKLQQLQQALAEVRTLRGMLPICASCKRIRDENGAWIQMEVFVRDRSHAEFSHSFCPECLPKYFPPSSSQGTNALNRLNPRRRAT